MSIPIVFYLALPANLQWFVQNLSIISIVFAVLGFISSEILNLITQKKSHLEEALGATLTAVKIPSGIAIILVAIDPTLLQYLSNASLYLTLAGLSLIWQAYSAIKDSLWFVYESISKKPEEPKKGVGANNKKAELAAHNSNEPNTDNVYPTIEKVKVRSNQKKKST